MSWLGEARRVSVQQVAADLGLDLQRCPACAAERRGRSDKRSPVRVRKDGRGWFCWACQTGGDGISLVAVTQVGHALERGDPGWRQARAWFAARGYCEPAPDAEPWVPVAPVKTPMRHVEPECGCVLDPDRCVPACGVCRAEAQRWNSKWHAGWVGHVGPAAAIEPEPRVHAGWRRLLFGGV